MVVLRNYTLYLQYLHQLPSAKITAVTDGGTIIVRLLQHFKGVVSLHEYTGLLKNNSKYSQKYLAKKQPY